MTKIHENNDDVRDVNNDDPKRASSNSFGIKLFFGRHCCPPKLRPFFKKKLSLNCPLHNLPTEQLKKTVTPSPDDWNNLLAGNKTMSYDCDDMKT